ncbi:MAG: hypothetical protein ABIE43_01165 [Patescibacteria group bacterium]
MQLAEFLKLIKQHGKLISNKTAEGWPWDIRGKYAELTSIIDFGCGNCTKYGANDTLRCCRFCRQNFGYHSIFPDNHDDLLLIANHFDKNTGFHNNIDGCSLPRRLRSLVCLITTSCVGITPSFEKLIKTLCGNIITEKNISPEKLKQELLKEI